MFASRAMDLCEVSEAAGEFQRLNFKFSFKTDDFQREKWSPAHYSGPVIPANAPSSAAISAGCSAFGQYLSYPVNYPLAKRRHRRSSPARLRITVTLWV